jgi:L-threonylcarbamoyladenylate synthase
MAVRIPAHPVALALLRAAAVPIAAPSANRSGQLSPTSAEHVLRSLGGLIDLILDGGPTSGGIESTVLDLTTSPPRLLRPGLLPVAELEAIIGPVQRLDGRVATAPLPSPGMLPRHYAPRTPLVCVESDGQRVLETMVRDGLRIGWLTFGPVTATIPPVAVARSLSADPARAAAQLYAALHELDDANLDRILVTLPPDTDAWLAIRDRLRRAAS